MRAKCPAWIRVALAVITLGIWFTAVYTSHHYIIDVALGILCAITGYLLFEYLMMRIPAVARLLDRYTAYVTPR